MKNTNLSTFRHTAADTTPKRRPIARHVPADLWKCPKNANLQGANRVKSWHERPGREISGRYLFASVFASASLAMRTA